MAQSLPYLVTVLASFLIFILAYNVGMARVKYGVKAPAVTGKIEFEYIYRTQMNTLESFAYFLPMMWVFSIYVNPLWAGILGFVWLFARIVYAYQYSRGQARSIPFFASIGVCAIYLLGSLYGIFHAMLA